MHSAEIYKTVRVAIVCLSLVIVSLLVGVTVIKASSNQAMLISSVSYDVYKSVEGISEAIKSRRGCL